MTLVVCLTFSLEYGILIGVGVNLLFIIYASSRPQVRMEELTVRGNQVLHVLPDRSLPFSAAEYLKLKIMKKALDRPDVKVIVLDGRYVKTIDVTLAEVCFGYKFSLYLPCSMIVNCTRTITCQFFSLPFVSSTDL